MLYYIVGLAGEKADAAHLRASTNSFVEVPDASMWLG